VSVVVTGAAGFVGRATVAELCRRGADVVTLDRHPLPAIPAATGSCLALTGDLLDRDDLADTALRTASAVLHLAGCPGVRDSSPDVARRRRRDNVEATRRVLHAVPLDVPVVVASSSSVYGGSCGRPSLECDALAPLGGYARSKVLVEELCAERARRGGLVTVVRPFIVVGENQRADMAIARWLRAAQNGRPLQVFGSLDRSRDFTDVREVARVLACLTERAPGGVLNIGTGKRRPLRQVVAAVAETIGDSVRTVVTPAASVEPAETWADTELLEKAVGFVPVTDLRDVVRRAAASVEPAEPVLVAS
jgi:nucleoside-diphosphate-sugar epimerase